MTSNDAPLIGVVATYGRYDELTRVLASTVALAPQLRGVVVLDYGPGFRPPASLSDVPVHVRAIEDNLGPAAIYTVGCHHVAEAFGPSSLLLVLDDDDPLEQPEAVKHAEELLREMPTEVAGVGLRGSVFDGRWARTRTPRSAQPAVSVSSLHGGHAPIYRVEALMTLPHSLESLFWGFEELAVGLELGRRGYSLWSLEQGADGSDSTLRVRPRLLPTNSDATLRRYYSSRNFTWILRRHGSGPYWGFLMVMRFVLKPLLAIPVRGTVAVSSLRLGTRGLLDGATDRLGFRGQPNSSRVVEAEL